MGSDESHFNVSLIVWDKVTRPCPQTTTFTGRKESRSGIEPRPFCADQPNASPLGQTGSHLVGHDDDDDELMLNVLRCHETY